MTARPLVMTLVLEDSLALLAEKLGTALALSGGNCQPEDSDLFFSEEPSEVAVAVTICSTCPIKKQCLQVALDSGEMGVWGGTTYAEREPMISRLRFEELPSLDEAKTELRKIMSSDAGELATKYRVERRTVQRWRTTIRSSQYAAELAGVRV
ncbi:MAG: hypothetical protein RL196_308 [Actinomycetota bacterium]|jgi:hypothetical protein